MNISVGFQALLYALASAAKSILAIKLFCFRLTFFCAIILSNCSPLRIMYDRQPMDIGKDAQPTSYKGNTNENREIPPYTC